MDFENAMSDENHQKAREQFLLGELQRLAKADGVQSGLRDLRARLAKDIKTATDRKNSLREACEKIYNDGMIAAREYLSINRPEAYTEACQLLAKERDGAFVQLGNGKKIDLGALITVVADLGRDAVAEYSKTNPEEARLVVSR